MNSNKLFLLFFLVAIFSLLFFDFYDLRPINLSINLIKYIPVGFFFWVFTIPVFNEISSQFSNNIFIDSIYLNKYQN